MFSRVGNPILISIFINLTNWNLTSFSRQVTSYQIFSKSYFWPNLRQIDTSYSENWSPVANRPTNSRKWSITIEMNTNSGTKNKKKIEKGKFDCNESFEKISASSKLSGLCKIRAPHFYYFFFHFFQPDATLAYQPRRARCNSH